MQMIFNPKFKFGQVVITTNANQRLNPLDVAACLQRHASGDWGEVCKEDAAENERSLKEGFRLLSAYRSPQQPEGERFWIITEADRSVTTVLLPEDY
jgi:hypothetical protein